MAPTKREPAVAATLTIGGEVVTVTHERVAVGELKADPNNPRLRFQIRFGARSQPADHESLLKIIRDQPGYDELQKQIRTLGGIHDPLIVRHDGLVAEGNSRLAAVTLLHGINPADERWQTVPVTRLPADLTEEAVELLMANFHIARKTVWRPFAQADHIYLLVKERKVDVQRVADEVRMTKRQVDNHVRAYEYLINEILPEVQAAGKADRQAILERKFSHALEFVQGKKLQKLRDDPVARKKVAELIATNQITGNEVRTKLPQVMADKKATAALLKDNFKAATEVLLKSDPTADSKLIKAIRRMTVMLGDMTKSDIDLFREHESAQAELKRLSTALANVEDVLIPVNPRRSGGRRAG